MSDVPRSGVQGFLDELPQASTVLDFVNLPELVPHSFFRVEVPHVNTETIVVHTVNIPAMTK